MKAFIYPCVAVIAAFTAVGAHAQTVQSQQAETKMLQGMGKDISDKLTAVEQRMAQEFGYIGDRCGAGDQMIDGSSGCRAPNGARMQLQDVPPPVFNAPPAAAQPVASVPPPPGYNADGTPVQQEQQPSYQHEGGGQ